MSTTTRRPPIRCTPCRVTYGEVRYQIEADGKVRQVPSNAESLYATWQDGSRNNEPKILSQSHDNR